MTAENRLFEMLISTEVKGDLLVLFHKNPGLIDTHEGVARRIGRIANSIEADVRDLVTLGILKVRQIGGREVLLFDRSKDRETQETIVTQLKTLKTRRDA
ncbi:MAG: hypothetical protein DMF76_16505 [Acidobacteria bacterium]|nr:MAG: hypothetical protein DMF76_16505 [Acidobacteriota bacterium]